MNGGMGRPVADLDDFLEPAGRPVLRPAPEPALAAVRRRSRAVWWIMGAALLIVAGGLAYWLFVAKGDGGPPADSPGAALDTPYGVAGFAELYVATFLTGSAEDVAQFIPGAPVEGSITPAAHYVMRTAALEVAPNGPGYWAVVVAADVLTLQEDGYRATGLQYYRVGVVDDGGRYVAVALPGRIPGPAPRQSAPRSLAAADQAVGDREAALVGDFLEALLTGGRDIDRYVSPAGTIPSVTPAPYSAIVVTSLEGYDDGSLLATVQAQEVAGPVVTMQYVLRIVDEAGVPLVAEVMAGPPALSATGAGR